MTFHDIDLTRTPGIYYALAYFLSAIVFLGVNKKRFSFWPTTGISVAFLVLISTFMLLTDGVSGVLFAISMLVIFGMIFTYFFAAGEMDWKKSLYFAMRTFIVGEMAASLEYQLFFFGINSMDFPLNMAVNIAFLLIIHPIFFSIVFIVERRYKDSNEELVISWRELIIVSLIGILCFLLSNASYAVTITPFSGTSASEVFALRTLSDFAGVGLLLAFHMQICELNVRMEKDYLHKLLHMQKASYKLSAESVELVNQKYHDLKHQIQLLKADISAGEKLRYLDEIEKEIQSYEAQNKTGNKALDAILTAESLKCQSLGITMTCVADGKELDFMKPTDISVLFGNILDNAIEGTSKIENADKRLIHLSLSKQKSFVRIRVENCCEDDIRFVNGLPTTKKDARYHGYGMKSIQSIVEKYDGSMAVKVVDGWFELRILLPSPIST